MYKWKAGRKLNYPLPQDLHKVIQEYFIETPIEHYTVSGLALAVGTKQILVDYEKRKGYGELIRMARLVIENAYELSLRKQGRPGDIFALKNMGWSDKYEHVGEGLQTHITNVLVSRDKVKEVTSNDETASEGSEVRADRKTVGGVQLSHE